MCPVLSAYYLCPVLSAYYMCPVLSGHYLVIDHSACKICPVSLLHVSRSATANVDSCAITTFGLATCCISACLENFEVDSVSKTLIILSLTLYQLKLENNLNTHFCDACHVMFQYLK